MQKKTLTLTYCAVLIAIAVVVKLVMNQVTQNAGDYKIIAISLAPAIIMFAGTLFGLQYGALVGAITDIICYIILPKGAYFPGYTLTMALYGILPALFLHKRQKTQKISFVRILLVTGIAQLVCSVFLNSLWLYIFGQIPNIDIFWIRCITACVSWPVYALLLFLLMKYKAKFVNPVLLKA